MSINLGLTSEEPFNCVVGFSGKIIDEKDLKLRKKTNFMLEAKDFFMRNNIDIETHLIKNCDHHIPVNASSIALNYILKKFNNS